MVEGESETQTEQSPGVQRSHLPVFQLHIQEVKVSENTELLLAGRVVQSVLSGPTLL